MIHLVAQRVLIVFNVPVAFNVLIGLNAGPQFDRIHLSELPVRLFKAAKSWLSDVLIIELSIFVTPVEVGLECTGLRKTGPAHYTSEWPRLRVRQIVAFDLRETIG